MVMFRLPSLPFLLALCLPLFTQLTLAYTPYRGVQPLNFTAVGCYAYDVLHAVLDGPEVTLKSGCAEPKECAQACSDLGLPLAGLKGGNDTKCQCGDEILETAKRTSICNNSTGLNVYQIQFPADIIRPTFQNPPFPSIPGKIILEEHASTNAFPAAFDYPFVNNSNEILFGQPAYRADVAARLNGTNATTLAARVAEMDKWNVSITIISLVPPGIQGILDPDVAVSLTPRVNDELSSTYCQGEFASRFRFFCNVALQEPSAAVSELRRCMKLPGAVGVFVSGYSSTGGNASAGNEVVYLDEPSIEPFWEAVAGLGVPVYIHPRSPQPAMQAIYRGYEVLSGSIWGFSTDVAVEALRLMLSGVFDRYPSLQIVLGHLGEGIPFSLYRMDQRFRHFTKTWPAQKTLQYYWENNVLMTTSGVQSTSAFWDAFKTTTSDRVMFSADTPFETLSEMASWFDDLEMSSKVKYAVAEGNARKWYRL